MIPKPPPEPAACGPCQDRGPGETHADHAQPERPRWSLFPDGPGWTLAEAEAAAERLRWRQIEAHVYSPSGRAAERPHAVTVPVADFEQARAITWPAEYPDYWPAPPPEDAPVLPAWHHLEYRVQHDEPDGRDVTHTSGAGLLAIFPHLAPALCVLLADDREGSGTRIDLAHEEHALTIAASPNVWDARHLERRPGAPYCRDCAPRPACEICGAEWLPDLRHHAPHDGAAHQAADERRRSGYAGEPPLDLPF